MTAPGRYSFDLAAFDLLLRIDCADAEVYECLQRYIFPPMLRTTAHEGSMQDIDLRVFRTGEAFEVQINGELAATAGELQSAALAAVKALDDAVVQRLRSHRAVHAGAVVIDGRALLLPGSSHAGKSSLVAELLRRGASCLSDEYALVDRDGLIHRYPRPLLLRNGSPKQSLVLPSELSAAYADDPAPVGLILALDYVAGGDWSVRQIEQGEAVMVLLRNTPHHLSEAPEMVDLFVRAVAGAVCYEGKRCEVAEAATRIMKLAREQ